MATGTESTVRGVALSTSELTGALGDSITVLPVVVALGALTPLSIAHMLLAFGLFQAVWGVYYGLPISVEPMKALAGLTIAGTLSYAELLAAGLVAGTVLLVAGRVGVVGRIADLVGQPVVRGVQFAVALLLAQAGVDLGFGAPRLALFGLAVAIGATVLHRRAGALAVLGVGTGLAFGQTGVPSLAVPPLGLFPAGGPSVTLPAVRGTAAQLAMTVGNAAVATSVLCSDLFDADVSPDRLAESMGAMSLVSVPLGGIPMCHGSGGLAGKHAFGARTGGANVLLGVLYVCIALVAGVWRVFPVAMLGVLLLAVAAQLTRIALGETETRHWLVVGIGLLSLLTNVGVGFVAGILADRMADAFSAHRS